MGIGITPGLFEHYQALLSTGKLGDLFKHPEVVHMYESQAALTFGKGLDEYSEEIDKLLGITSYSENEIIVDLGGGTGLSTQRILLKNPQKIIVVDASEAMLVEAKKKFGSESRVELKVGNAEELSDLLQGEAIDKVVSISVFKYFSDPDSVLRQIHQVLSQNGEYVFNVHLKDQENHSLYQSFIDIVGEVLSEVYGKKISIPYQDIGFKPRYTRKDLESMAGRNNFDIKIYQEIPLVYKKDNLRALHDNILEGLEFGLTQELDSERAREITAKVKTKLEERYSEDKDYVFGKEAYVCLVRK